MNQQPPLLSVAFHPHDYWFNHAEFTQPITFRGSATEDSVLPAGQIGLLASVEVTHRDDAERTGAGRSRNLHYDILYDRRPMQIRYSNFMHQRRMRSDKSVS